MPAGVSWGQYLKFMTGAMLSMMAGSQLVHTYYKPLKDINVYIEKEMENVGIGGNNATDKIESNPIKKTT